MVLGGDDEKTSCQEEGSSEMKGQVVEQRVCLERQMMAPAVSRPTGTVTKVLEQMMANELLGRKAGGDG